ncbi:hypothetical protein [Microbacterium soli]|uniref:DUF2975 domain-containing protein n=1 Tax=Microbacterium soli TaxID=446075 RepID=A0ABP7N832_9MICO
MAKDARTQAIADRNDFYTAIVVGALIVGWLVYSGIRDTVSLFENASAVTVTSRIPVQEITAAIGSGATASVDTATLVVQDVNSISIASLVIAIATHTLGLVATTALAILICRRLLRGLVFDGVNVRLTLAMSMVLLVTALGSAFFSKMGLNGVFAVLDSDFDFDRGYALLLDQVPLIAASFALGVLVIVFRRGALLQRETEGLV